MRGIPQFLPLVYHYTEFELLVSFNTDTHSYCSSYCSSKCKMPIQLLFHKVQNAFVAKLVKYCAFTKINSVTVGTE
jgi:hypothetical protein